MDIFNAEKHKAPPPAGIKFNPTPGANWPASEPYSGISFCEAVHIATEGDGRALTLDSKSITVCRWSRVVLGFNEPDPKLDLKVGQNLRCDNSNSTLIASLAMYSEDAPPDVVLLRAKPEEIKNIIAKVGYANLANEYADDLGRSALSVLAKGGNPVEKKRVELVNAALARLNKLEQWRDFTKWIFKRQWTTYLFDLLLDEYLANMSMCRNSTVIPFLSEKLNASFFCTGGVSWGMNNPEHIVCGMPFEMYNKLIQQ